MTTLREENEWLKKHLETLLIFANVSEHLIHAYDAENRLFAEIAEDVDGGWRIRGNLNDHEYDMIDSRPWGHKEAAKSALREAREARWSHILKGDKR